MAPIPGCRACGAATLRPILSLGDTPLANRLISPADAAAPEPRYPLDLVRCPACSLVQITETVPPEVLFGEYLYFSSYSDTMLKHADDLAGRLIAERNLTASSLAVEIASNDGYLLRNYLRRGVPVLGIEPARNIAKVAVEQHGVPTLCEFFSTQVADRLAAEGRRADVLHAHNVLAHVADLNGVVEGFRRLLADDGRVVVEAPYLRDLVDHCEFDTIYHEHLCYFSVTALDRLMAAHGLELVRVDRIPLHGGSLQLRVALAGTAPRDASVQRLLDEEAAWGVMKPKVYESFATRVRGIQRDLRATLEGLKAAGKRVAAYGASAKGATLLNTSGIGADLVEFVVDRSPVKQGRLTPGTKLPILPPAALLERRPDAVLLLTWNFADEILAQQAEYRAGGGRFIIPVPEVRTV